jgi:hypothetical protein
MIPVSAQAVEKDLAALWDSETREAGLNRVYTTNLVAYASDSSEAGLAEKNLLELMGHHPGRYILIKPAAGAAPMPLKYDVSGHCVFQAEKGKMVCCDLVKLEARPDVMESLYGFTFSLLMADLPVARRLSRFQRLLRPHGPSIQPRLGRFLQLQPGGSFLGPTGGLLGKALSQHESG